MEHGVLNQTTGDHSYSIIFINHLERKFILFANDTATYYYNSDVNQPIQVLFLKLCNVTKCTALKNHFLEY